LIFVVVLSDLSLISPTRVHLYFQICLGFVVVVAIVLTWLQYKKQQLEMQYQLKKKGMEEVSALSIDQCQGQEADFVLLSLVQRPTRFLDKHRFNVALSRVRKRLFLVTNLDEFREASENSSWDCSLLAKDLLKLSRTGL
jgi:hypothetical protein